MAKLTLLLATFALFLLAANATIYQTTAVINDEESESLLQQRCQQQFQEQQELNQCQMFLSELSQGYSPNLGQQGIMHQCCHQLGRLDTECQCPVMEHIARYQLRQGQLGDQQMCWIIKNAQSLPTFCGMSLMRCDFVTLTMDNRPRNDQQRCYQQFQEQQELPQCKSFLSQRILELKPYGSNPTQEQEIQQCCRQLEQLDTECRCPGLLDVTRSQVMTPRCLTDRQMRQTIQIAESIPSMCNMKPMECDLVSEANGVGLRK